MNYLSVCAGIEAASCAWHHLGWKPAAFSEIEAFPRAVLQHHYPDVPLHGDFTTIKGDEYGPVDLLAGGTPCQSFSVAGLRRGIHDERGNLALEFLLLAGRTRPRWLVWENVPGVFSSLSHDAPDPCPPEIDLDSGDGPRDGEEVVVEDSYDADESHAFGCFLAGLSELGYGFAYRVLDAQYFGVPQRRRRVFLVGYLGDWRRAAAVLFERESLLRNPPPSRQAGQGIARSLTSSTGGCSAKEQQHTFIGENGRPLNDLRPGQAFDPGFGVCGTLSDGAHMGGGLNGQDAYSGRILPTYPDIAPISIQDVGGHDKGQNGRGWNDEGSAYTVDTRAAQGVVAFQPRIGRNGRGYAEDVFPALNGADAGATSDMRPCIAVTQWGDTAGALTARHDSSPCADRGQNVVATWAQETADPITANEQKTYTHEGSTFRTRNVTAFTAKDHGADATEDLSPTLRGGGHSDSHANGGVMPAVALTETADCLYAAYGTKWNGNAAATNGSLFAKQASAVRRLTPRECERLQGFPDDYTLISYRGKPAADGPRYKALGNSMAVPVMRWIGERIAMVEALTNQIGKAA